MPAEASVKERKATPFSKLCSHDGRRDRADALREALLVAAGTDSAEEVAEVVFNVLVPDSRLEFQTAFERLASPQRAAAGAGANN